MKSLVYFQGKKEENTELIKNYDMESDHLIHKHSANLKVVHLRGFYLKLQIFRKSSKPPICALQFLSH